MFSNQFILTTEQKLKIIFYLLQQSHLLYQRFYMPERDCVKAYHKVNSLVKKAAEMLNQKYYGLAERELISALLIEPNQPNALFLYACCLFAKDRQTLGAKIIQKVDQLNPCYKQSLDNNLQNIVKNIIANFKDTKDNLKNIEDATTFTWVDIINVFSKHKDLGNCSRLLDLFKKIKKPDSEYSTYIFSNFGLNLYELGRYEQSIEMYRTAMAKQPQQFRYYNNSAILLYVLGHYTQSQQHVHQSLALKPNYAKSLFILSFALAKTSRQELALTKIYQASNMTKTSIQYRLKIVTILLIYFPAKVKEVHNQLQEISKLIEGDKDSDQYFSNKDNRPYLEATTKFLIQNMDKNELNKQDWTLHAQLLDDYLIKGHVDKYRITVQAKQLREKIKQDIQNLLSSKNINHLPQQLLKN